MMTRQDYLDVSSADDTAHRRYNAQFVSVGMVNAIESRIGLSRLLASTDEHLNDIPLNEWDRLDSLLISYGTNHRLKQHGDFITMAGIVCIAKEAARQAIERAEARGDRAVVAFLKQHGLDFTYRYDEETNQYVFGGVRVLTDEQTKRFIDVASEFPGAYRLHTLSNKVLESYSDPA